MFANAFTHALRSANPSAGYRLPRGLSLGTMSPALLRAWASTSEPCESSGETGNMTSVYLYTGRAGLAPVGVLRPKWRSHLSLPSNTVRLPS